MEVNLANRVALVTGGGRGIGGGCSIAIAEAGADVAVVYRKDAAAAQKTVAKIKDLGRSSIALQCDVSREDQVNSAIAKVLDEMGRIDILVSNAGVGSRLRSVRDSTSEEMRWVYDINAMGTFWCCRGVIDSMREQGRGHIIIVSSTATLHHNPNRAAYVMAKTAQESLARVLSKEEGPNGIRVNVIAPGLTDTDLGQRTAKAAGVADIKDLNASFPFGRVGSVQDIGNLAAFLCSDEGGYISGQVIYVDGGAFMPRAQ